MSGKAKPEPAQRRRRMDDDSLGDTGCGRKLGRLSEAKEIESARNELERLLEESYLVSPAEKLIGTSGSGIKTDASDLTLGSSNMEDVHFTKEELKSLLDQPTGGPSYAEFVKWINESLNKAMDNFGVPLIPNIMKCKAKICDKLKICGEVRNVTELRFVIGDPFMEMLCDTFHLKVCIVCTSWKL